MAAVPIAVAGAGIAGLAAALALARRGVPVLVLEQADGPYELGNGLQLGPNATRLLCRLDLHAFLAPALVEPERLVVRSGLGGGVLASMPLGRAVRERYGAPYWTLARRSLHRALTGAAGEAGATIRYAAPVTGFSVKGGVEVEIVGEPPVAALGLVGADGLWSKVRDRLGAATAPRQVGHLAWRATAAMADVPEPLRSNEVVAWVGPRIHVVHYPIDGGATLNLVVVTEGATAREGWEETGDEGGLRDAAARLAPPLAELVLGAAGWRAWPLFETEPPLTAGRGPVTLIGDAAHPMLPYAAQGAGMAIEDAVALAAAVAAAPDPPAAAFRHYERVRRDRVLRTLAGARRNGWIFHLDGPMRLARDMVLRLLPGRALLARYDWLYRADPG